jgi:hypothetical protein
MERGSLLRHRFLTNVQRLTSHAGKLKLAFTISSFGYCAVHWLFFHGFSIYVFSTALAVGAVAAMAVARLSHWFSSPST